MNRFLETLHRSGYRQFYLSFGDANFRHLDWPLAAKNLTGPLLDLVKLFLLQQPVARTKAKALLGQEWLAELIRCGVLREQGSALASNSFFLIYCRSYALFCQMTPNPWAYFGEDSLALVTHQTPAPGGRVLDLCCGPGIQSFAAASQAASVTGVEIRPETWRIAELNHRLNRAGNRLQFANQSAADFAKTSSEKYDRILFNPPLVPMVPGYKFAFVGNGGADGLDVTRNIVQLYHRRLTNDGSLEFIGTAIGRHQRQPPCDDVRKLARRHGLGGRIHVFSRHPIRPSAPLFESLVLSLARDNGLAADEARKILRDHFAKMKADTYWLFFASLNHTDKHVATVDMSQSFWGNWFV